MGLRAHVIEKYEVEYVDGAWFNYGAEELRSYFEDNNIDVHLEDIDNSYSRWEIPPSGIVELNALVSEIEKLPPDDSHEALTEYTNRQVANIFREWLKYPTDEYIRINWF